MTETNLSISQEKSRFRALMNALFVLVMVYGCFFVLSAMCFAIMDIACHLKLMLHETALHVQWKSFFTRPFYIFELYGVWWDMLLKSMRLMNTRFVLLSPFIIPAGMALFLMSILLKRNYSFSLWYVLNYHFAKLKDIESMGLNKGMFMVLGRFADVVLSVRPSESVLCIGEMGSGKTSSVAIPSVLHSDNACVIAVDMTGLLPKYTAGHRANLGKVLYYNWDLLDDTEKQMFYPRWNPLAEENMPKEAKEKDAYLKRIAGYLVDVEDREQDNYWNLLAHSIISAFLGYWTTKVAQARANDYFLQKLVDERHFSKEEKDILLSFYIQMPPSYATEAIENLKNDTLTKDNYLPIGSWAGVPEQWIGKEVCFAAITDWIISNYMTAHDADVKDWRDFIGALLRETMFFGYGALTVNGLKQFLALSVKQRHLAFACVMKPFQIFTNPAVRERTNGNDFNLNCLRGIYDEASKRWCPVTVYSQANTHASKILNQMFLEEALYRNLNFGDSKGALPIMFVLDDVGHNLRLKNLTGLLTEGKTKKMSALLLCNSLSLVEDTYSKEELECVVMNTSYKIIKAPNNQRLSHQLDKLATFATKSVQIPKVTKGRRYRRKKYFADAVYFHRLALDFKLRKNIRIDTKDHQIVLAEGYYNRPILADNIFFAEDDKFSKLAVLDADYTFPVEKDVDGKGIERTTPKLVEVFNQKDLGVEDLVELDQYMKIVFNDAFAAIHEKSVPEKEMKFEEREIADVTTKNDDKDWWLDENSFMVDESLKENPFNKKK